MSIGLFICLVSGIFVIAGGILGLGMYIVESVETIEDRDNQHRDTWDKYEQWATAQRVADKRQRELLEAQVNRYLKGGKE